MSNTIVEKNKGGRPKGSISETTRIANKLREKLAQEVEKRWPELQRASFDAALGHYFEETDKEGNKFIYRKSPDINAIKYLKDQVIGKAKETVELDNPMQNEQLNELSDTIHEWINQAKRNTSRRKGDNS